MEAPIEVSRSDSETAVVVLRGEHDLSNRSELEGTLQALLHSGSRVVVDISEAEFIDSSILTALLASHRLAAEHGSCLVLQLGTAPIVKRVLEISGVLEVLPCAPTREHAVELAWLNRNGDSS